jgi:predicted transcriptional regulator
MDIVDRLREAANPDFGLSMPDYCKRLMQEAANEIHAARAIGNAASRQMDREYAAIHEWIDQAEAGGVFASDLDGLRAMVPKPSARGSEEDR